MREEIWHAPHRYLAGVPAEDVHSIAESLDAALDPMASIATGTYAAELERALAESEAWRKEASRLATIVAHSQHSIVVADLKGQITEWNPGAEHPYGYSAEEMIGRLLSLLMLPERLGELSAMLRRVRRGGIHRPLRDGARAQGWRAHPRGAQRFADQRRRGTGGRPVVDSARHRAGAAAGGAQAAAGRSTASSRGAQGAGGAPQHALPRRDGHTQREHGGGAAQGSRRRRPRAGRSGVGRLRSVCALAPALNSAGCASGGEACASRARSATEGAARPAR